MSVDGKTTQSAQGHYKLMELALQVQIGPVTYVVAWAVFWLTRFSCLWSIIVSRGQLEMAMVCAYSDVCQNWRIIVEIASIVLIFKWIQSLDLNRELKP